MTNKPIILDNGSTEYQTQIESTETGTAKPDAGYTHSPESETIGQLTTRVYGTNTKSLRDTLRRANTSLNGLVRIPKS